MTRAIPTVACEVNLRVSLPDTPSPDDSVALDYGRLTLDTKNILIDEICGDRYVVLPLRFVAANHTGRANWYSMSGTVSMRRSGSRPIGAFFQPFVGPQSDWLWFISPDELQSLSQEGPSSAGITDLYIDIQGLAFDHRGMARAGGLCPAFTVPGSRISLSNLQWFELLNSLASSAIVFAPLPLSPVVAGDPSWLATSRELADSWKHLMAHGSEYASIKKAYDALTRALGIQNPARKNQLEESLDRTLPDLKGSKRTAVRDLLVGVGQMGQRLGHHAEDMDAADRPPVTFWEAQILLSIMHLTIAYILRLKAEDSDSKGE